MKLIKRIILLILLLLSLAGATYYFINRTPDTEEQAVSPVTDPQPEIALQDTIAATTTEPSEEKVTEVLTPQAKPKKRIARIKVQPKETPVQVESAIKSISMPSLSAGTILQHIDQKGATADSMRLHPIEKEFLSWESDTLPVKKGIDLLRIKKVGRFDRGIVNYRFMPKGQWLFGIDASFWDFNGDNNKLLFTYLDNFTFDARTVAVAPFFACFLKDNQAVGVKLGYKYTSGYLGNVSFKIDDDVDFSLKDLGLKEKIYSCTFFHRSYIGLDPGKRFGLFNETGLNIGLGRSEFTRGTGEGIKSTRTDVFEAQLGISPGMAVFLMQNVSVECSVGIVGFKYRREDQVNSLGEKGLHTSGGANFKINLFDINLGLIISL